LKPLRSQQGVQQVNHQSGTNEQHDDGLSIHTIPPADAITELHVRDRDQKKSNRDCSENKVPHISLLRMNAASTRPKPAFEYRIQILHTTSPTPYWIMRVVIFV